MSTILADKRNKRSRKNLYINDKLFSFIKRISENEKKSISEKINEILEEKVNNIVQENPVLKLDLISFEYVDDAEQKEIEDDLKTMTAEDLKPTIRYSYNQKKKTWEEIEIK